MKKWEYKIIVERSKGWVIQKGIEEFEKKLNGLGEEGWELVGITPIGKGGFGGTSDLNYYFKRELK